MTDDRPDGPSAPWERPARWEADEAEVTRAEDLIARLSGSAERRRRRARDDDTGTISVHELLASLGTGAATGATETAAAAGGGEGIAIDDVSAVPGGSVGDAPEGADATPEDAAPAAAASADAAPGGSVPDRAVPDDSVPDSGAPPDGSTTDGSTTDGRTPADAAPDGTPDGPDAESPNFPAPVFPETAFAEPAPAEAAHPGDTAAAGHDVIPPPGPPPADRTALDDPDPSPGAHADGPTGQRGWLLAGRSFMAVLSVLLLVVVGTEWVVKLRADAGLADNAISAIDPTDDPAPHATPDAEVPAPTTDAAPAPVDYAAETILIIGTDSRHTDADIALGGVDGSPGGSDVIMLAHLAADRSHVTIVSIPRDMYIDAPTCRAWDYETGELRDYDYTSPYRTWRINSTFAAGGPRCTVQAVQALSGLTVDRVIVMHFAGFTEIVDSLGGITVNACTPIIDGNLGTVLPVAGEQHIDGQQALNLVRARKVQGDKQSDLARIRRQQKVVSTMLREAMSTGVLLNPVKLDSVLQSFVANVQTDNVTVDDLLHIAQSLGSLSAKRVTFYTLPTVPDPDMVGLQPAAHAAEVWAALRADKPLPGEEVAPPSTTPTPTPVTSLVVEETGSLVVTTPEVPQTISVAPGDVDLQVVNVTGRSGVATRAKNALVPLGFSLRDSDLLLPPGQVQNGNTVEYSPANRDAAVTVAATVPGAVLQAVDGLGTKVRLLLGSDFDGDIRPVAVGDAVPSALSSAATPVTSTVTSTLTRTVVTTPPLETPSTSSAPSTTTMTSVNAAASDCI